MKLILSLAIAVFFVINVANVLAQPPIGPSPDGPVPTLTWSDPSATFVLEGNRYLVTPMVTTNATTEYSIVLYVNGTSNFIADSIAPCKSFSMSAQIQRGPFPILEIVGSGTTPELPSGGCIPAPALIEDIATATPVVTPTVTATQITPEDTASILAVEPSSEPVFPIATATPAPPAHNTGACEVWREGLPTVSNQLLGRNIILLDDTITVQNGEVLSSNEHPEGEDLWNSGILIVQEVPSVNGSVFYINGVYQLHVRISSNSWETTPSCAWYAR